MTDKPPSKHETGTDILRLEPRIVSRNYRWVITGREHSEHVLHGEPPAANNGLATEHVWMRDDPIEQLPFIHQEKLPTRALHHRRSFCCYHAQ